MSRMAEFNEVNGDLVPFTYGLVPNKVATWDFRSVYGCVCDDDWQGYDCSERTCLFGDDGTTKRPPQTEEVQHFRCTSPSVLADAAGDTFTLTFRQHTTRAMSAKTTAADVEAALQELDSIEDVDVVFFEPETEFCSSTGSDVFIRFYVPSGDVPDVILHRTLTTTSEMTLPSKPANSESIPPSAPEDAQGSVDGTTEYDECSGRGLCDRTLKVCDCFSGFGASNGRGSVGSRPDCGYLLSYVPVAMNEPAWR